MPRLVAQMTNKVESESNLAGISAITLNVQHFYETRAANVERV